MEMKIVKDKRKEKIRQIHGNIMKAKLKLKN